MQPAQDLSLYNILRLNSNSVTMFTLQKNKLRLTYNVLAFFRHCNFTSFFPKGNFISVFEGKLYALLILTKGFLLPDSFQRRFSRDK